MRGVFQNPEMAVPETVIRNTSSASDSIRDTVKIYQCAQPRLFRQTCEPTTKTHTPEDSDLVSMVLYLSSG